MHSACAKIKVERSGEVERSPERSESMFVSVAFKKYHWEVVFFFICDVKIEAWM